MRFYGLWVYVGCTASYEGAQPQRASQPGAVSVFYVVIVPEVQLESLHQA
jgi:hypothetical protein